MQGRAFDQKAVFHALAQGADFGQVHAQSVVGQDAGDGVEQAGAVGGGDGQQPLLGFFIGAQQHARRIGKAFDAARQAALGGCGQRAALHQGDGQVVFHHVHELAVLLLHGGGDDLEGVQRVAVVGGVHAGVKNRKTGLVEIAADAGKQIGLIGCVDQHLQAFAGQ